MVDNAMKTWQAAGESAIFEAIDAGEPVRMYDENVARWYEYPLETACYPCECEIWGGARRLQVLSNDKAKL